MRENTIMRMMISVLPLNFLKRAPIPASIAPTLVRIAIRPPDTRMAAATSAASAKPLTGAVNRSQIPTGLVPAFSITLPSPSNAALKMISFSPASFSTTTDVGTNHVMIPTITRKIITMANAEGILNVFFIRIISFQIIPLINRWGQPGPANIRIIPI